MSEELPGAGTSQLSGASQPAAAAPAEAAPQPAAQALYDDAASPATQQHAPEEAEASREHAPEPDGDEPQGEGERGADSTTDESEQPEPPQGAPEKYEFKPVEGVTLSEEVLGTFSEVAKELNLSQDAAQKMLDRVAPAIAQQQHAALHALGEQWVSAVKADKEIGGAKLDANIAIARKARNAFGSEALRSLLNETRLGNHPEVIKFFVKVGKAISEDTFVPGGTRPPSGGKDAASVLYGKQT